jgi:membrane protease YdiL (CAAX protease family)
VRLTPRDAWLAVPIAWVVFYAVGRAAKAVTARAMPSGPAWRPHAVFKVTLLVVSFGLAAIEGIRLRDLGFAAPSRSIWGTAIGAGLALGAAGTLIMLAAGAEGLRKAVSGHSFVSIVVWFWVVSSVAEEVFCRGWFQTSTIGDVTGATLGPLLPSAVLFGSLHLVMLSAVDRKSVAVVVASTTILGLLAAWARATTGSLYPAIAAHVAFNVGGLVGGGVYAGAYRAATGRMPFAKT